MSAIAYSFRCATCHADFMAAEAPENSYGLFVLRTENADDAAYLDAYNDSVFMESYEIVKENKTVANVSTERRGEIQQAVFAITCDPSLNGELYKIGLLPKCPVCGSRTMVSWQQIMPIQLWTLPLVKHIAWNANTLTEKKSLIDQAIQNYISSVESRP